METEQGADLISSLPRDVLLFIVSKIPLKEAIATEILSTAWKNLWKGNTLKLEMGVSSQTANLKAREKIKQSIGTFLMYSDHPEILNLCINSVHEDYTGDLILKVVEESMAVVTKGKGELHFDFKSIQDQEQFISGQTKFNLILENGTLKFPGFSSLKILCLRSVNRVGHYLVPELFSSCVCLESLTIEKCSGLLNLDIKANIYLRELRIIDCFNIKSIKLVAPALQTFVSRGILSAVQIDAPKLVDATLNFRNGIGYNNFDCEDILGLIFSLKDVEKLTISGWILECLCKAGVIFGHLAFKFERLKELICIDSAMDAVKRDSLACFLNTTTILEHLCLKVDGSMDQITSPHPDGFYHEPHLWKDYAEVKSNATPLVNLKTIQLVGLSGKEVLLMDLLLHMAVNLEEMKITFPDKSTWEVRAIPRSQLIYAVKPNQKHRLISSPNAHSVYLLTPHT